MTGPQSDHLFAGSLPQIYDRYLVPLIFAPYAERLARRLASRNPERVLEIAAGTGAVTRAMASTLPAHTSIVATDLNQAMLDHAAAAGTKRPVAWQRADAQQLPFEDGSFDAVVCQFGAMFFPDKATAFSEARRVLGRGGLFIFAVWDRIEENDLADVVTTAVASLFPEDPPRFLARTPHGYYDRDVISRDVAASGFRRAPSIETVRLESRARSFRDPAIGFCQGTPLRNEIEARDPSGVPRATEAAAEAVAGRFGRGPVSGWMQAHVVTIERID
jgi:SAM-dependent methyltransferase